MPTPQDTSEKVKKSLRYSVIDGSFFSVMVGFGESFFIPFATFLRANNVQLGLLGSLPITLGSLGQLLTHRLLGYFKSRKHFVCWCAFLQGLMFVPIIVLFLLELLNIPLLLLFMSLYWIFGMLGGPAWNSWMGELVNEKERGNYFGRRNRIAGLVSVVSFLGAGYLLQQFAETTFTQRLGFVIIFCIAFFARTISTMYLAKKYDPPYHTPKDAHFTFLEFLKEAPLRNYGRLVMYLGLMNFGVFLAAPFFTAYMFYDLAFDYQTFTIVSVTALLVKFLCMPLWGRLADRYGTKKILTISGLIMPLAPLLWIFSTDIWYILGIQAFNGFIWAGFEIAAFNFTFETTTPEKRALCVAYNNVVSGLAIVAGAVAGGYIIRHNEFFWSKYYLVFILSFLVRFIASAVFIPKLREIRQVEQISYHDLIFKIFTTMPTMGLVYEIIPFWKEKKK